MMPGAHRVLLVGERDDGAVGEHGAGGFVGMNQVEHGPAMRGEIFDQRGVRARQAGVAVLKHDHREARRRRRRRGIDHRMRLDGDAAR